MRHEGRLQLKKYLYKYVKQVQFDHWLSPRPIRMRDRREREKSACFLQHPILFYSIPSHPALRYASLSITSKLFSTHPTPPILPYLTFGWEDRRDTRQCRLQNIPPPPWPLSSTSSLSCLDMMTHTDMRRASPSLSPVVALSSDTAHRILRVPPHAGRKAKACTAWIWGEMRTSKIILENSCEGEGGVRAIYRSDSR